MVYPQGGLILTIYVGVVQFQYMSTLKQKDAIAKLVGNRGNITQAMRDAKYSENTINTPKNLTDSKGFKEEAKPFIEQLQIHRQKVIKRMEEEVDNAQYQHLNSALDTTTKLIQLLSGGATDILKIEGLIILPNKNDGNTKEHKSSLATTREASDSVSKN